MTKPAATPAKVVAAALSAADMIQAALWENRRWYGWVVTGALLGLLGASKWLGLSQWLLGQLVAFLVALVMLGPTAEQFGKWLSQLVALRTGVRAVEAQTPAAPDPER